MNKDMVYFELIDACNNNCCPICELIKKRTLQSMDGFLYESVNDISIRKELKDSRGLCNYHSRLLLSMGDPLSHAIIYTDLIKLAINDIEKEYYSPYEEHLNCRYCKAEAEADKTYSAVFLNSFLDKEFQDAYKTGGILCMSHLHAIQCISEKNKSKGLYEFIKKITVEKYKELIFSLSEIIRKNDYRYSDEKWTDNEKMAWKRAVGLINSLSKK